MMICVRDYIWNYILDVFEVDLDWTSKRGWYETKHNRHESLTVTVSEKLLRNGKGKYRWRLFLAALG
jgi:hypothetical protein